MYLDDDEPTRFETQVDPPLTPRQRADIEARVRTWIDPWASHPDVIAAGPR